MFCLSKLFPYFVWSIEIILYLICYLQLQNQMKTADDKILLLFLTMLYLLGQNRQLDLYRLLLHSFLLQRMRILEVQKVAVQKFTTSCNE